MTADGHVELRTRELRITCKIIFFIDLIFALICIIPKYEGCVPFRSEVRIAFLNIFLLTNITKLNKMYLTSFQDDQYQRHILYSFVADGVSHT